MAPMVDVKTVGNTIGLETPTAIKKKGRMQKNCILPFTLFKTHNNCEAYKKSTYNEGSHEYFPIILSQSLYLK